jgi:hypothetical protein
MPLELVEELLVSPANDAGGPVTIVIAIVLFVAWVLAIAAWIDCLRR